MGGAGLWLQGGGVATAGYALAPDARGRGFATAALHALTAFAWTRPDLERWSCSSRPATPRRFAWPSAVRTHRLGLLAAHTSIGGTLRDMQHFVMHRPGRIGTQ